MDFTEVAQELQRTLGPQFTPLPEWVEKKQPANVEDDHRSQQWWTDKVHQARKEAPKENLPLWDKFRLHQQSMPHTTA
jgi:hypothetical protein